MTTCSNRCQTLRLLIQESLKSSNITDECLIFYTQDMSMGIKNIKPLLFPLNTYIPLTKSWLKAMI